MRNPAWRSEGWAAPFFVIWTGQAFSLLGSHLVQFALVWWLTQTTGSATVLATATLAAILPQIFLGFVAGPLADRVGVRAWYLAGGLLTSLIGIVAFVSPAILGIEQNGPAMAQGETPSGPDRAQSRKDDRS